MLSVALVSVGVVSATISVVIGNAGAGDTDDVEVWLFSGQVRVGVGEALLTDELLVEGLGSLDWGVVGDFFGDVVVSSSLTRDFDSSCDLADGIWSINFDDGLDVDVLVSKSGAIVSDGFDGLSSCLLLTGLRNVLLHDVCLSNNGFNVNVLGVVDKDGTWDLVGSGGWDVDGLNIWFLLGVGLDSGDGLFFLDGAWLRDSDNVVFSDSLFFLDGACLRDGDNVVLGDSLGFLNGACLRDGDNVVSGNSLSLLLSAWFLSVDDLGDSLWFLGGELFFGDDWNLSGGLLWDSLGDSDVIVRGIIAGVAGVAVTVGITAVG